MSESDDCRVCDGFKSWMKKPPMPQPAAMPITPPPEEPSADAVSSLSQSVANAKEPLPCPPDSLELGSSTWTFLHTMASYYPDTPEPSMQDHAKSLITSISHLYPCSYCAKHLREELLVSPPRVESRTAIEIYMCELHNEVNERIGKPTFDCSRVRERWRDGPADRGCG